MFFKRAFKYFLVSTSFAILFTSAIAFFTDTNISIPFLASGPTHSLTGLKSNDSPVLVVKIDDTTYAHPQVGLRSADVVYIEQVEGGLTRLAAVFSSTLPDVVGPIRSARISDIELLAQYGKVGFAYSGAQRKMWPVIAAANLFDVGATKYGPKFYSNDLTRTAPYAMMLKVPQLVTEAKTRGTDFEISKPMGWSFGDAPTTLRKFSSVHISWPAASYEAQWSVNDDRWLLTHDGIIDVDDTGYQLGPKTLMIQLVSITDSIYKDKVGGVTPLVATVGEGKCYLLRNGGVAPCLWNRPTAEAGTTFTDTNGKELTFDRGKIWFALTAKEPVFTGLSAEGATTSASK